MINRRQALLGIAALGGAASMRRLSAKTPERFDVAVIGAGLAGLYAAMLLEEAGARVVVIEGSGRAGGRVRTMKIDGEAVDLGATGIGPTHGRARDLVRRFKLPTERTPAYLPAVYSVNGGLVTAEQWPSSPYNKTVGEEREITPSRIDTYFLDKFLPFEDVDEWLSPKYAHLDVSVGEFLKSKGLSDEALRLANIAMNCADIWDTSALPMLRDTAKWRQIGYSDTRGQDLYGGGQYQPIRCVGGNERLVEAMVATLKGPVRLKKPVAAINHSSRGVVVHCIDGSTFEAGRAIITVPLTALRNIEIYPALPLEKAGLIRDAYYSGNTQFILRVKKPFWEADGLPPSTWTDTPIERVFATYDSKDEISMVRVWINGDGGRRIEKLPVEDQARFVIETFARVRPSTRGKVEFVHRQSWTTEQLIQGEKFFFSVGQVHRYAPHMATPVGPLHFAGAHHRNVDQGMEAALQSGERAALEVISATI